MAIVIEHYKELKKIFSETDNSSDAKRCSSK
jgi:hypothetical protein